MKVFFYSLLCLTLSACNSTITPEQDYLKRLETVLNINYSDIEQQTIAKISIASFPKDSELQVIKQQGLLTIREFLSIRECQLHTTIAHRNSLIGKVSSPSQQLFSDLMILQQGPECLPLINDKALATKLRAFLDLKQAQLKSTLWAALLAQDEHRQFWRVSHHQSAYPDNVNQDIVDTIKALSAFTNRVLTNDFSFSKKEFSSIEQQLGLLRFGDGGQLLNAYLNQIQALTRANHIIKYRLEQPLCLQAKPTPKAHHFDNVIRTYFIDKVQRVAVKLNQRAEQLLQAHKELEQPLIRHASAHYIEWVRNRDALISQGKTITTEHVKLIQALYKQCGLSPQRKSI